MISITFKMKDGTERRFVRRGRAGGDYSIHLKYEGAFAIVVDEWYNQTAIPAIDIVEIKTEEERW